MQSTSNSFPSDASGHSVFTTQNAYSTGQWRGQWLGIVGFGALLSFSWVPNSYLHMVGWPYCLWWQSAFCLLLGWSIWISRQFSQPLKRLGHGLDWIVLLLATGIGLSTITAQFKPVAGWNILLLGGYGIALYVGLTWLRQSPQLKKWLWLSLAFAGTVTNTIGLVFWRPTADIWSHQSFYTAIRNPWPLGHHNFVGGYALLMLPIITGLTLTQISKWRWPGVGAIALNITALYISGSRGALLGATVLGILSIFLYAFSRPSKTFKHWIAVILVGLCLAGLFVSNPRVRSLITLDSPTQHRFSIEQLADGPTKDRLFMLQAGWNIFKTHPLTGVGPGNLSRVYNLYRPVEVGSGLELVQQLHNTPAQILAELGLIGFIGYLLWLGTLTRMGLLLYGVIDNRNDRILLYSIAASWFAYGVSSLTDYQLENIGIATALLLTTALLIHLGDCYLPTASQVPISQRIRRLLSLCLLLYFSLSLQAWGRTNIGFYLASAAQKDAENLQLATADKKWTTANKLLPWDPTYAALSAERLVEIADQTNESESKEILTTAAIASFEEAVEAAPNDPWFHQNLAVLYLATNQVESAIVHLRQTALLAPRSQHSTYYLLGHAYLQHSEESKAITSFVLESLANPSFLINPVWDSLSCTDCLQQVLDKTLDIWSQVLSETVPQSRQHTWLNQQIIFMKWWYHRPLMESDIAQMSPYAQAVLSSDHDPQQALVLLNEITQSLAGQQDTDIALLKAWLSPERHLDPMLQRLSGTDTEKQLIVEHIHQHRELRSWLTSIRQPKEERQRYGLAFAYRNYSAQFIRAILTSENLNEYALLSQLALCSPPPREFPQLDRKISDIGHQDLALDTLT